LNNNNIKHYFDQQGYSITVDGMTYFYDLTIPEISMVIEYQSRAWHADPTLSEQEWNNWRPPKGEKKSAKSVLEYDYNKARSIFFARGFRTYYVWERSREHDVQELLCLLKTLYMK
jgi:hypothetical protein